MGLVAGTRGDPFLGDQNAAFFVMNTPADVICHCRKNRRR